jgi:hypothetical protein
MRSPFGSDKPKPESPSSVSRAELQELLPASVRQPEVNRFKPLDIDPGDAADSDAPDEDLQFLESLANAVDNGSATPSRPMHFTKPQLGGPEQKPAQDEGAMEMFRNTQIARDERVRPNITVPDVELGDLMEDLATLRTALRQRKAA